MPHQLSTSSVPSTPSAESPSRSWSTHILPLPLYVLLMPVGAGSWVRAVSPTPNSLEGFSAWRGSSQAALGDNVNMLGQSPPRGTGSGVVSRTSTASLIEIIFSYYPAPTRSHHRLIMSNRHRLEVPGTWSGLGKKITYLGSGNDWCRLVSSRT